MKNLKQLPDDFRVFQKKMLEKKQAKVLLEVGRNVSFLENSAYVGI